MTHDSEQKSMVGICLLYKRKSWWISFFVQTEMIKVGDIFRKEVGTSHQQQVGNESNGKVVRFSLAAVNLFNDFFFSGGLLHVLSHFKENIKWVVQILKAFKTYLLPHHVIGLWDSDSRQALVIVAVCFCKSQVTYWLLWKSTNFF